MKKSVAICDTQPVTVAGLRAMLDSCPDLEFHRVGDSMPAALEIVRASQPALLIIDKAFGSQAVLEMLDELKTSDWPGSVVVWGVSMTEVEALRFVRAGARGSSANRPTRKRCWCACGRSPPAPPGWREAFSTPSPAATVAGRAPD